MRLSSRLKLMTVFSLFLIFVVGFTLFRFVSIPTHAAGTKASITLSFTYGPPTSVVGVSGKGFKGGETVALTFDSTQIKSVKASKTGSFSATITVPSSALPGNHFVQGRGSSSGFFAQAAFLVQTDWVQQGFNREHTGYNVFENVLNTTNVSQLTQSWVYPNVTYSSVAIVANNFAYIGCYGNTNYALCAFNATTGQLLWSYSTGNNIVSTPAVASGLVYFGSPDGKLYALNAATGQLVWSYATGFTINDTPLIANGLVYIGASNGVLYALNGVTGHLVWKSTFQSIFSTPSIDGGLLYVSAGGSLYALTSSTGKIAWHVQAQGGTPVIANGIIYLSDTVDNKLLALKEQTGALLWSNTYPNSYATPSDPSVANGVVYITLQSACNLEALSATTGAILWQYNSVDQTTCIENTPAVANGVVYAGSSDDQDPDCYCSTVYMLSAATGAVVGGIEEDSGDSPNGNDPIVVVNGTLYYSATGSVYAYHLPGTVSKKSA
ncbi:MAG: PQQ-binding-like beta-propeller repeat protein [Ktedonobacteraceae bacterium]